MTFIKNNSYLLIALSLVFFFAFITVKKWEQEVAYEEIVVNEGDTLWAYSEQYGGSIPTNQWIEEIIKINQLASTHIQAGETILIPMKEIQFPTNDIATNSVEAEE